MTTLNGELDISNYSPASQLNETDLFIFDLDYKTSSKRSLNDDDDDEIIIIEDETTTTNKQIKKTNKKQCNQKPVDLIILDDDDGDENAKNETIHEYQLNECKIIYQAGDMFKTKSQALLSIVNLNMILNYIEFINKFGQDLINQLKTYTSLLYVPNQLVYQFAITRHLDLNLFHTYLESYEFLTDKSEIKFDKVIRNLFNLLKQFNNKSVCIPLKYWLDAGYPQYLLIDLIHASLNNYLTQFNDHQMNKIIIHIDSNQTELISLIKSKYPINQLNNQISVSNDYTLEGLNFESDEFRLVSSEFKKTLPNAQIYQIEKIVNPFLERMYSIMKETIRLKHSNLMELEWKLFHGTDLQTVYKICQNGFNRSYAGRNGIVYGRGVYFARDSKMSNQYSIRTCYGQNKLNELLMLMSLVIVGEYELGNSYMIDTNRRGDGKQFDSTVNQLIDPTVFVIYRDYQAIPKYLIHYSV